MKHFLRLITLYIFLFFTCAAANKDAFRRHLDGYLSDKNFNGVILIAQDGRVLFEQAYGMADSANKIPNQVTTQFMIGSLTKQFTGALVVKLWEQQKLDFNKTLEDYLPHFNAPWASQVSINQILGHRSGIPNNAKQGIPEQLLRTMKIKSLNFIPGTRYQYSNGGYNMLGIAAAHIAQLPIAELYHSFLFKPAGMESTYYPAGNFYKDLFENNPNVAMVYGKDFNVDYRNSHDPLPMAAGGIVSTVYDLWRWNESLYEGKILSKRGLVEFVRSRSDFTAQRYYAAGIIVKQTSQYGLQYVHNGKAHSHTSFLAYFPHSKVTIVFLSNYIGMKGASIGKQLIQLVNEDLVRLD